MALKFDAVINHAGDLQGASWPGLVAHWSAAGGAFDVHQLTLTAGDASLDARKGGVAVGDDGYPGAPGSEPERPRTRRRLVEPVVGPPRQRHELGLRLAAVVMAVPWWPRAAQGLLTSSGVLLAPPSSPRT